MKTGQNTFVTLLDLLKVKHTEEFSNRYFNEHPHKYNLFGLSKMLSDYGAENAGSKICGISRRQLSVIPRLTRDPLKAPVIAGLTRNPPKVKNLVLTLNNPCPVAGRVKCNKLVIINVLF